MGTGPGMGAWFVLRMAIGRGGVASHMLDTLEPMALTPEELAQIRTRIPESPSSDIPMPYEDLVRTILTEGHLKSDRTGTGTISLFGRQMRFDLAKSFPLLTTKTVFFRSLAYELLWFLKGSSNVRWLQERNVHIWDKWADENGDLGPVYGVQWRSWPAPTAQDPHRTIDQIANVLDLIRNHPDSRRMVVSAWNPAEVENMALPPCHALFQFYVSEGRLSCQLYQRSCDMFLGVPFNIASYSLLTMMMAQQTGLEPGSSSGPVATAISTTTTSNRSSPSWDANRTRTRGWNCVRRRRYSTTNTRISPWSITATIPPSKPP